MKLKKTIQNSPPLLLILGFATVIFLGTILLSLPISSVSGEWTDPLTSLFTATSAVCVTGLVVVDTGTYFNTFGHSVLMLLIQVGGIGIMAFGVLFVQLFRKKLSLRNHVNVQETYNSKSFSETTKILLSIFVISFISEFLGMLSLSTVFVPEFGLSKGLFYSLFHSISAFNNAGFDLMGNYSSLTGYSTNLTVNITMILLITFGSLGFLTILELYEKRRKKKSLSLTTKSVLLMTTILLIVGTVSFMVFEFSNTESIGNMNFFEKIIASIFLSVTPRTAGFNTIDMTNLSLASSLIIIILMYIGASPTSTGGGLKTTTILIPILSVIAVFKGKEDIELFGRRISKNLVSKSLALLCVVIGISLASIILLSASEPNASFLELTFEVASAINTVGLSLGVTASLSPIGQIIIIFLMFIGRVGPITIVAALALKHKKESRLKFVEEKILIG